MMTQKIIIVAAILCLGVFIASVIKFIEEKRLTLFSGLISLFMPMFLVMFMVHFYMYVYKKNVLSLGVSRRIFFVFKLMVFVIQILPLLHTTLVKAICDCMENEPTSKIIFPRFQKNILVKSAVEELHGKIFLRNKYVF